MDSAENVLRRKGGRGHQEEASVFAPEEGLVGKARLQVAKGLGLMTFCSASNFAACFQVG